MYDLSRASGDKDAKRTTSQSRLLYRPMHTGAQDAIVTIFIYRVIRPTLAIIMHVVGDYSMLSHTI